MNYYHEAKRRLLLAVLVADNPEGNTIYDGENRYSDRLNRLLNYVAQLRPAVGRHLLDAIEIEDERSCDVILAEMMVVVRPLEGDILYVFDTTATIQRPSFLDEGYENLIFVGYESSIESWSLRQSLGCCLEVLAEDGRLHRSLRHNAFVIRRAAARWEVESIMQNAAEGADNVVFLIRHLTGLGAICFHDTSYVLNNGRELAEFLAQIEHMRHHSC